MQNKGQFRVGTSLAKQTRMKQSVSLRYLMLVAGVLVAIMIAITVLSQSFGFMAENITPALPTEKIGNTPLVIAKALVQKVSAIIF
jgi:hypothetical protein